MGRTYSVLIIDDDKDFVFLLKTALEAKGHQVRGHSNIDAFFRAFRKEVPDIVMVDMVMADMPGWQICEKLRKAEIETVKIVAMSSLLDSKDTERMKLSVDTFVAKPIKFNEVDKLVSVFDGLFEAQ